MAEIDGARPSFALLLAAHGERSSGASNAGMLRLAATLRRRQVAPEITVGFVKAAPGIAESARTLRAKDILVYPMFLSDGYFTRIRVQELLQEAFAAQGSGGCSIVRGESAGSMRAAIAPRQEEPRAFSDRQRKLHILPALGLEPLLVDLIIERLVAGARARGVPVGQANVILLAHGSGSDPASRMAAERLADGLRQGTQFRAVRVALLEEAPPLRQAASDLSGAILVFGLFAGEGMHGAGDALRLIKNLNRADAVFAGTVASLGGIADLIAAAVGRAVGAEPPPGAQAASTSHGLGRTSTCASSAAGRGGPKR